jgi:type IV pilus assembly protein PilA
MKNRVKGFTMMELIVVMAILAVLCGVLVPNGLAWIRDSKLKTCNSEAKTVFNTAVTVLQDYQLEGNISTIASSDGTLKLEKGDSNEASDKITSKLGSNFGENSVWYVNSTVANYNDRNTNTIRVISALFADNSNSEYIGRYPVPANKKSSGGYSSIKDSIVNPTEGVVDAIYDGT